MTSYVVVVFREMESFTEILSVLGPYSEHSNITDRVQRLAEERAKELNDLCSGVDPEWTVEVPPPWASDRDKQRVRMVTNSGGTMYFEAFDLRV